MNPLQGKVAAVTGAASGLGKAMAQAFAAEGMRLALADVDEKALDELQLPGLRMRVDVSKADQVEAFAARALGEFIEPVRRAMRGNDSRVEADAKRLQRVGRIEFDDHLLRTVHPVLRPGPLRLALDAQPARDR